MRSGKTRHFNHQLFAALCLTLSSACASVSPQANRMDHPAYYDFRYENERGYFRQPASHSQPRYLQNSSVYLYPVRSTARDPAMSDAQTDDRNLYEYRPRRRHVDRQLMRGRRVQNNHLITVYEY